MYIYYCIFKKRHLWYNAGTCSSAPPVAKDDVKQLYIKNGILRLHYWSKHVQSLIYWCCTHVYLGWLRSVYVQMTCSSCPLSSVVEDVFVSHLEADIPEFRHLIESSASMCLFLCVCLHTAMAGVAHREVRCCLVDRAVLFAWKEASSKSVRCHHVRHLYKGTVQSSVHMLSI